MISTEEHQVNVLKRKNSLILILVFLSGFVFPQNNITPVEKQAHELMKFFTNPAGSDKLFAKSFLDKVPANKLNDIFKQYYTMCGSCTKIEPVKVTSDYAGKYDFYFEKNTTVTVTIGVELKEPYLINSLFFSAPVIVFSTENELLDKIAALPGEAACTLNILVKNGWGLIIGHDCDKHLAIGSAFKLYILSELLRTVNNGERNWKDYTELKKEAVSLPSGILHTKPVGTKITVDSLASLMISISDNTATDNLLYLLGSENVEKIMPVAGHSKPGLNIPFLATNEMFKLKGDPTKAIINKYLSSVDKRQFLKDELSGVKRESFVMWNNPSYIDKVEWFASTNDLCNVMGWIKANSENEKGKHARDILAINPGINISKEKWSYVGYKGGSEPGVINMTFLLCSKTGKWYSLSFTWNNQNAPVDNTLFIGIVSGAIKFLENSSWYN
ncbi:MAG: hypothetical protein C0412_21585 [Flavobacterium sp.]|nr:hypothetical protein [Flavobacterium sp.]